MTPRVGITAQTRTVDGLDRTGVNTAYPAAVTGAGGAPLLLPPVPSSAASLVDGLDAIVFSGGADLDPSLYRTPRHPRLGRVEPERDAFEIALFHAARARRLPILAICRGAQLVNVALGGTLWQDLESECPGPVIHHGDRPRDTRVHDVTVTRGSQVAAALGREELGVNSFHHQGVRDLAPTLRATGLAADGLVEAFESTDGPWLLGVQWHPEAFWREPRAPDLGLFTALVTAARGGGR